MYKKAKMFLRNHSAFFLFSLLVACLFAMQRSAGAQGEANPLVISSDASLSVDIKSPVDSKDITLTAVLTEPSVTNPAALNGTDLQLSYIWTIETKEKGFAVIESDGGQTAHLKLTNITGGETGRESAAVTVKVYEPDNPTPKYTASTIFTVTNSYEITKDTKLGDGFAPFHKWNQQYPLVTLVIKDDMPVYSLTVKDGHRVAIYDNGANNGWNGSEADKDIKDNMHVGRFKGGITVSGGGVVEFHRSEFVGGPVTVGERGTFASYYGTRVLVNGDFKIDSDTHDASRIRIGDDAGIAGRTAGLLQIEGSFKANDGKSDRKIPSIYMYNLSRLRVKGARMDGDFNFTVYNHPQNIINAIFWQGGSTRWYAEYINGSRTPLQSISPVHMEMASAEIIDAVAISKDVSAVGTKIVITETSGDSSTPGSGDIKFKVESADVYVANITPVKLSTYTGTAVAKIAALPVINAAATQSKPISSGSAAGFSSSSAVNEGGKLFLLTMPISNDVISGDKPIDNTSILVSADRTGYLHLAKLTKEKKYVSLPRVTDIKDVTDGKWAVTKTVTLSRDVQETTYNASGDKVINTVTTNEKVTTVCKADEKFSKEAAYNIVIGVKDNGLYDHNASEDIVTDPVVLYTDGTFAEDPKSGGSNGGGCSAAGWSVLALAPLGIFALYGRRKK